MARERQEREWDDYVSWSGLQTFEQCPRRWAHTYLDKRTEPQGDAAFFGNLVHDALERVVKGECYGPHNYVSCLSEVWGENQEEIDARWTSPERMQRSVEALRCVANGVEKMPERREAILHAEYELDVDVEGVRVKGYIDRVDEGIDRDEVILIDYKTGKPPRSRYYSQAFQQLKFYALAYELQNPDARVCEVKLHYLRPGVSGVSGTTLEDRVGNGDTAEMLDYIRFTWQDICESVERDSEGGHPFFERTGPLCGWCGFKDECEPGQVYLSLNPKYQGKS